jgi:hypothetical protein
VFVVEQDCAYPDMDDHDLVAWHLTGTDASGRLLGVARLLPPGEKYQEPSLGRVVVTVASLAQCPFALNRLALRATALKAGRIMTRVPARSVGSGPCRRYHAYVRDRSLAERDAEGQQGRRVRPARTS